MDIEQLISQYLDGELSSEAEGEFHQKLSISPEARTLFREHLKLQSIARDERVLHQPTAPMRSALFARLQEEEGMAPIGALPLIEEKETPSPVHSPIIAPAKPRAVPIPSGDRTSIASSDDPRSEEKRRKRRLIPILIPLMLLCIVGGIFLVDGNFFGGNKNGEEIAYNAPEESGERATTSLSDRDYSDPANPVVTETPTSENATSRVENPVSVVSEPKAKVNRRGEDQPQLRKESTSTFAYKSLPALEPDEESFAALTQEDREEPQASSPSPKRLATSPSVSKDAKSDSWEEENEAAFAYDESVNSEGWDISSQEQANDRGYSNAPSEDDSQIRDFGDVAYDANTNIESSNAIAPSIPLQDGLSLSMRPETQSTSSRAEGSKSKKSEENSPALILSMSESSSDKPLIGTTDNQKEILDLLKQHGIDIDTATLAFTVDDSEFNLRGGRGNAPLAEQNSGFEILERTDDSVRIGYGIGRAAAQNMQTSFTLSTEDFESLGGVDGFGEGLSLARDGAVVTNPGILLSNTSDNTGNIYQQDSILNGVGVATNATTYSVGNQKWQSTTNLPNASSPMLGEGNQEVEEKEGMAQLSEASLDNSTTTISAESEEGRTFFIGIEGGLIAGLNSSESSFLSSDFAGLSESGVVPETRLSFGIDLGSKGKHRFFGTIGLSPYSEREISRTQTTARSIEQVTETLVSVDASGVRQTVGSVTREQISTSTSTSMRDAERNIVEMWGGVGYRFSIPLVREWETGLEVVGGIGTQYAHASFAIPISYSLGNTIRVEFKPGMHYRTSHTTSEPVTTGTLDPTAPSSSRIESRQGPAADTRFDAGAGFGLILFLR